MKKITYIIIALSFILTTGCSEPSKEHIIPEINSMAVLSIDGMMCEKGCKSTIQSHLNEMEGVLEASVDYEAKKAEIKFDNRITSSKKCIKMINNLADGIYSATLVEEKKLDPTNSSINSSISNDEISVSHYNFTLPNFFELLTDFM